MHPGLDREQVKASAAGFTLLEILIAILVLSIGVLGVAGMQVSGLKGNQETLQRSQAAALAYEIADRMRANPVAARSGAYQLAIGTPGELPAPAPAPNCRSNVSCSPVELAASDLYDWRLRLHDTLPVSTAKIECRGSCTGSSLQVVTLYWDQYRTGATGTACTDDPRDPESTRDPEINLSCVRISVQP